MSKQEINTGLIIFEQIQQYGYFNSYKLSCVGGAIGILNNPVFNPAFLTKYHNIYMLLKIASGGWINVALNNSNQKKEIVDRLIYKLLQDRNNTIYDNNSIEKMLREELKI